MHSYIHPILQGELFPSLAEAQLRAHERLQQTRTYHASLLQHVQADTRALNDNFYQCVDKAYRCVYGV